MAQVMLTYDTAPPSPCFKIPGKRDNPPHLKRIPVPASGSRIDGSISLCGLEPDHFPPFKGFDLNHALFRGYYVFRGRKGWYTKIY